jgi:hypothetical protein
MDTGIIRDFAIIISGGLILVLFIVIIIFAFLLYREIKTLTSYIKGTVTMTKETINEMKQAFRNYRWLINMFKPKKEEVGSTKNGTS